MAGATGADRASKPRVMSVLPKQTPAVRQPTPQSVGAPASGVTGAIQRAAQATGGELRISARHRQGRIRTSIPISKSRTSSATGLFQFIEQTWLGMMKQCRARRSGSATMPTRFRAIPTGAIRSTIRSCAARSCNCARIRPPMRQWPAPSRSATPPRSSKRIGRNADRRRALHRAFLRHRWCRRNSINAASEQSASQCGRDVSRRGARQPIDLLRQAGQCAQRRRASIPNSIAATRSRAPMCCRTSCRPRIAANSAAPAAVPCADATRRPTPPAWPTRSPSRLRGGSRWPAPQPAIPLAVPQWRRSCRCDAARCRRSSPSLWGAAPADRAGIRYRQCTGRHRAGGHADGCDARPLDLFRDTRPDVRSLFRGGNRA